MKSCGSGERAPLRTILRNFLNHVETLEKRKNGVDDQYDKEFQELKLLSESLKGLPDFLCLEGEKDVNRRKNRYKDILPFDYTRVTLSELTGIPGSDYINANYIRGASGSHAYIASQGPLAHTVVDFWRMVIECDVQVIIMACNEEESGKHKCENYWVESEQDSKPYGPYTVKLLKARRMCNDFNLRTMELTFTNAAGETVTRTVVQFHYWAWPDHGVPALVRPLLEMVRLIRDCQASETLPLLIHCSAGCGRTGTICAIDYVWGLLRAGKLTEDFSLFELIAEMRRQRVAMVQTKDQYILVHRAVRELFIEQLKMIDAHPYENLDVNGHPLICPPQDIRIDPSYETIFVKENQSGVLEVKEDEDVCHEESTDQIPWTVLQYQSNPVTNDSVPPLPDKKRKVSGAPGEPGQPDTATSPKTSPPHTDPISDIAINSSPSSKESTPPSSLERPLLKLSDSDPSSEGCKEEEGNRKHSKSTPSPNSGLVRKSSILKLRAFFEKSNSEPRGDKKSKSSSSSYAARKANSFRIKEAPSKFYRSLEEGDEDSPTSPMHDSKTPFVSTPQPSPTTELDDYSQREKIPKPSMPQGVDLVDCDAKSSSSGARNSNHKKSKDAKPNLPVKRSKSMKVYRGFDIRTESSSTKSEEEKSCLSSQQAVVSVPCDIVLSKTPSITYIPSKEKLHLVTRGSPQELSKQSTVCSNYDNLDYYSAPLTTSSLDRGKDQRPPKPSIPTCGSLDRNVSTAQIKIVPTYVNVLIRNQEAAHTSKLDDDTRQLLQDCQAYLMHSEPNDKTQTKDEQRLNPLGKKYRNRSLRERRHSFKQAVIPDPEDDDATRIPLFEENSPLTNGSSESVVEEGSSEASKSSRAAKKVHEYEAIWLSGVDAIATPPSPSATSGLIGTTEGNNNCSGVLTKDSVFIQKSDEIRLLLNELRSGRSNDDFGRQYSPTPSKLPLPFPVSNRQEPISPRLHPERVLCELQELVERANRSHEESIRTPADSIPTGTTPSSPSVSRKPPYVNYPQPNPRTESSKLPPSSPAPARYIIATPSTTTNTANAAIIAPIPIKLTSSIPPSINTKTSPHSQTSATLTNTPSLSPSTGGQSKSSANANSSSARASSPQLNVRQLNNQPSSSKTIPTSPSVLKKDLSSHAPAFRPPPPYPTNLFVKLPPLSNDPDKPQVHIVQASPKIQRRTPPEYKDPPPVKRGPQLQSLQPVAPPRSKRHVNTSPSGSSSTAFPMGPPVPGRSFSISQPSGAAAPGIDLDAVAAVMAASENSPKLRSGSGGGSSSPTTAANKALSKALGKFQATAASFKTKLAQLSDTKDVGGATDSQNLTSIPASQSKMERETNLIKPTVVYVGDGITVVNTSETTTYIRKKQQYL